MKGISVPVGSWERLVRDDWKHCMAYFNVEKWRDCVKKLEEGYDTTGVCLHENVRKTKRKWYYGNFWWATSDYIKTCMPAQERDDRKVRDRIKRFAFELWLFNYATKMPRQKAFCFYDSMDFYTDKRHLPDLYRK
jgi:hypothetical protein